jgi:hypothetical protein
VACEIRRDYRELGKKELHDLYSSLSSQQRDTSNVMTPGNVIE